MPPGCPRHRLSCLCPQWYSPTRLTSLLESELQKARDAQQDGDTHAELGLLATAFLDADPREFITLREQNSACKWQLLTSCTSCALCSTSMCGLQSQLVGCCCLASAPLAEHELCRCAQRSATGQQTPGRLWAMSWWWMRPSTTS